jgi:hypothetical protein
MDCRTVLLYIDINCIQIFDSEKTEREELNWQLLSSNKEKVRQMIGSAF